MATQTNNTPTDRSYRRREESARTDRPGMAARLAAQHAGDKGHERVARRHGQQPKLMMVLFISAPPG